MKSVKGQLIVQIKANQPTLFNTVKLGCDHLAPDSCYHHTEKSRNRNETRTTAVFNVNDDWIEDTTWNQHIACIFQVKRHTEIYNGKKNEWQPRSETAYYLSTHYHSAEKASHIIRNHWGIENSNHHVRDVSLNEDASRIRTRPGVFARLRSFALNVLRFNQIKNIREALFENALDFEGMMCLKGLIN